MDIYTSSSDTNINIGTIFDVPPSLTLNVSNN